MTVAQRREIAAAGRTAIEVGAGARLDRVVASLKARGYDSVAFLVHVTTKTTARNFASPEIKKDAAEIAILFPNKDVLARLAVSASHESLHLFGADDLYTIRNVDTDDRNEVMHEYCTGFGKTRIGGMTAHAIGWRETPPIRKYGVKYY
jgi:hypothetical protein